MKQLIYMIALVSAGMVIGSFVRAQSGVSFILTGLPAQKVPVTCNKMTNLVFPMVVRTGIKVSREILVQKVKGVENVIELKAVRPHFAPTNLSVFGLDGRLYSFELEYVENPSILNFAVVPATLDSSAEQIVEKPLLLLTGLPVDENALEADAELLARQKGFLHGSVSREKMRLQVKGIYLKDSLLWLVLRITNHSQIPYQVEFLRLFTQDRKKAKRTAVQQTEIGKLYGNSSVSIPGESTKAFALGFPLFTLSREKRLSLEVAERNGGRGLQLPISYKKLLKAREYDHRQERF